MSRGLMPARARQDDVLYESLTVYETLMYAGLLRLPRTMTKREKVTAACL